MLKTASTSVLPSALAGRLALWTLALAAGSAWSQSTVAPSAPAAEPATAPAEAASAARATVRGEPSVQRTVVEDDSNVIQELRVRGQTQSVVVQSKLPSVRPYEFVLPVDGRDAGVTGRGAAGQRVWQVLKF